MLVCAALLCCLPAQALDFTQRITLQPGWNSVWLEADPKDRHPAAVFAGLPLISAWTWSERISSTDFIQSPDATGWNRDQWLVWFPPQHPEAAVANLHAILPLRPYLIRLGGSNAVEWSVTGRPVLRASEWTPDRFNLRGFPIDPERPPTFRQFFRPSSAHYRSGSDQLEDIFRLSPDGQWSRVAADELMGRGIAYWVYSRGASSYIAPFSIEANTGERVDFDATLRRVDLNLQNHGAGPKSIRIEPAGEHASPLLLFPPPFPGQTNAGTPLVVHDQPLTANAAHRLNIGLDRSRLATSPASDPVTGLHTNLLKVSDGEGTLFNLGIVAIIEPDTDGFTGLWAGTVNVTNVSTTTGAPGSPGAVPLGFPMRILIHVDDTGAASLLRDVTLIYQRTAADDDTVPDGPTQLLTDPAQIARVPAADVRAGVITGRRLSAPHFEFALAPGQFGLALSGVFAPSNAITGTLSMPSNLPTHPFLHRYHPDHGTNRTFDISRNLQLSFDPTNAPSLNPVQTIVTGSYSETISGLHRQPLFTSGSFQLHRISTVGQLNVTPVSRTPSATATATATASTSSR